jgi:hypothetical protein
MPTAKFTHEPGTPEYQASEWLMTIHNASRELDFAISNSPNPAEVSSRSFLLSINVFYFQPR